VKPRVAVIGSGVAGLTAAYVLRNKHEVTLFEKDSRIGGHAHTHTIDENGKDVFVDSGFIVHNRRTYPTLLRIFEELNVETQPTEMSMSITCEGCGLSYAGGRGFTGIFAQPWRLLDLRYLRMLIDVPRFHRLAHALLASNTGEDITWGQFLKDGKFSEYFIRHFAVPLVSCVWSSGDQDASQYPAKYLFAFLNNHGMLSVGGSPLWRTVTNGSIQYVTKIAALIPDVRLNAGVSAVVRHESHVDITLENGTTESFDKVVIATHANAALAMLKDVTEIERHNLSKIDYSQNLTWLHTDESILPKNKNARGSWNYRIASCDVKVGAVQVTYWMNNLQSLTSNKQYVVSLNPDSAIDKSKLVAEMHYEHPLFTVEGVKAAEILKNEGGSRLAFAGAHFGWGFHEDGARSGLEAAKKLGASW
jgi:predicted NAD/FAD-binding protein